jgi:hypothetical protein
MRFSCSATVCPQTKVELVRSLAKTGAKQLAEIIPPIDSSVESGVRDLTFAIVLMILTI